MKTIGKIKVKCGYCKKDVLRWPSGLKAKRFFCSRKHRILTPLTLEHKKKLAKLLRSYYRTEEWNKKIVVKLEKWKKENPDKYREMAIKNLPKNIFGENNGRWIDGRSFLPYPPQWNSLLKESIKRRDGNICQLCRRGEDEVVLSIHHIDHNKENCDSDNLITLCRTCHGIVGARKNIIYTR